MDGFKHLWPTVLSDYSVIDIRTVMEYTKIQNYIIM